MGFSFENFKKEEKEDVEKFPEYHFLNDEFFESQEEETGEEYISRIMKNLVSFYKEKEDKFKTYPHLLKENYYGRYAHHSISDFFKDELNGVKIKEHLDQIKYLDDVKFSEDKNKKILLNLENSIWSANRELPSGKNEDALMDYYDKTNQRRDFFEPKRGKDAHSYVSMMFALPEIFVKTKDGNEYIHRLIDDKNIFLFGGGDSVRDLLKSEEFKPKKVINFDPFIKEESIDKNPDGIYESEMISASDKKIREMVNKNEIPKADEVWATYSVPFYLDSSDDIKELILNMSQVLSEGGNARICPISVQSKEQNGENFETRKQALIDSIKNLIDNPDYNVTVFNNTLKIHRIKKEVKQNDF